MQIEFHPEATKELEASAKWYAERSLTAARSFLVAVDLAIRSIARDPERFAFVDDKHRSGSVTSFPFQVVFRYADNLLTVVAVAHAKRRPGYWRCREER
jgi:plasmid stabilization system protein ParE